MREIVDILGEQIEQQLQGSLGDSRRRELEQALSRVLNGDRDLYQAYVARLRAQAADETTDLDTLNEESSENIQQAQDRVTDAAQILGTQQAQSLLEDFDEEFAVWQPASRSVFDLLDDQREELIAMQEADEEGAAAFVEMRDAIDQLQQLQEDRVEAAIEGMEGAIANTTSLYIIVVAIALIASGIFVIILTRGILKSVYEGTVAAEAIADGDLNVELTVNSKDENRPTRRRATRYARQAARDYYRRADDFHKRGLRQRANELHRAGSLTGRRRTGLLRRGSRLVNGTDGLEHSAEHREREGN